MTAAFCAGDTSRGSSTNGSSSSIRSISSVKGPFKRSSGKKVFLPRELPDQSLFQSDSEQQGEEFEDAESNQDSRNPEARSAVTELAYDLVAAREQCEGVREVGNKTRVNARTGVGEEGRQEMRVVDRDQGSRTRPTEVDDHESLIPQVLVPIVQERIDAQSVSAKSRQQEADTVGSDQVWKKNPMGRPTA
ncbi:hypothetical protein OUZ56_003544 [Daphnia magna]|uniref:Uncharacterized protein n=1 Tax=Daphnia magna TaxID=35525 RepID=A0ABR0A906_9CRUS|nr:hypothetical protein OUZ56_003544 [Daphnia magna]